MRAIEQQWSVVALRLDPMSFAGSFFCNALIGALALTTSKTSRITHHYGGVLVYKTQRWRGRIRIVFQFLQNFVKLQCLNFISQGL